MADSVARSQGSGEDSAREFFFRLGGEIAAPLMVGMINWMVHKIRASKPDMILFLSRDGEILREIWEKLCPDDLASIPHRYLLASRRALRLASLRSLDQAFCEFMTSQATGLSIRQLFERVGLDEAVFLPILSGNEEIAPDLPMTRKLEPAVHASLKVLEPNLLRVAESERRAYLKYLESEGVAGKSHLAVVDVGWHGSLQLALSEIMNEEHRPLKTDGYYLGVFPDAISAQTIKNRFNGYILDESGPAERFADLHRYVEIVEFLFSSSGKSLVKFEEDKSGNVCPVYGLEAISDYQRQAIQALRAGCLAAVNQAPVFDDPYPALRRLGLHPTAKEAEFLAPIQAARGFGNIRYLQPFAASRSRVGNLVRWNRFFAEFKNSLWRPGFWARLSPTEQRLLKILSPEGTKHFRL